jgi:2-haloalkanoic acid dehalogenase type II
MTPIISFDLDGTIMTSDYADHVWLEGLPQIYAKEKQTTYTQAKKILTTAYNTMGDDTPEWYDLNYWIHRYHLSTPSTQILQQYTTHIQAYQDAIETIHHLTPHYTLIIISNAKHEFIDIELKHTNLTTYFTHRFSSLSDFNQVKKHPQVYQNICTILNISPQQLIHVGDHLDYDYNSPRKIGVHAYYINRSHSSKNHPDYLSNLNELLEKIHQNP